MRLIQNGGKLLPIVLLLINIGYKLTLAQSAPPDVGIYSAISPKLIASFSTYNISVFVEPRNDLGNLSPLHFHAEIRSKKENYTGEEIIVILPGHSGLISIPVKVLTATNYNLTLKIKDASTNAQVENTTIIFPKKKEEALILLHADKSMYKPGETVNFRVVLLNPELKPIECVHGSNAISVTNSSSIPNSDQNQEKEQQQPEKSETQSTTVKIFDPEQNTIKIWEDIRLKTGLFSGKLQLSTEPILGDWTIEVVTKTVQITVPKQRDPNQIEGQSVSNHSVTSSPVFQFNRGFISSSLKIISPRRSRPRPRPRPRPWRKTKSSDTKTLKFTVAQYVLPKFQVTLKLPPFLTFNQTTVPVHTEAKYTYGGGVKGECTLTPKLADQYHYHYWNNREENKKKVISSTFPIDGSTVHEVDIKHLFKDTDGVPTYEQEIKFNVQCTEGLTGKSMNASASVQTYRYPYKIEDVVKPDQTLKPGLPFSIAFKILTQDNIPIHDPSPKALKISHGFSYDLRGSKIETAIPSNGLVPLTFATPANELIQVSRIEVTYKDLKHSYYVPQHHNEDVEAYMEVKLAGTHDNSNPLMRPTILENSPVVININCTVPFKTINYIIHGGRRQEVLQFKKVNLGSPVMEHNIEIKCPLKAAPEARIIVYILTDKNQVIVDSLKFSARPEQGVDNYLNITLEDSEFKEQDTFEPGKNVNFKLDSKPNSLIALRGVDQSVLLLKEGDVDITQKGVDDEIKSRVDGMLSDHRIWGGSSAFQVFEQGGLAIMTNAQIQIERAAIASYNSEAMEDDAIAPRQLNARPMLMARTGMRMSKIKMAAAAPAAGFSSSVEESIRVRTEFPETWLWEEVTLNASNSANFLKTIPDTLTSWIITGYSLNTDFGLGVLPQSKKLTVVRPFFLSLNLPYSVVKGEVLVLQVLVHNYLNSDGNTNAEITLENSKNQFEFNDKSLKDAKEQRKTISCPPNSVTSVTFIIIPSEFGSILLNVKGVAQNPSLMTIAGDALSQPLRVKPPGQQQRRTASSLIKVGGENSEQTVISNLTTSFPNFRVPGADRVKISFISDILGSTIANLDKMIKMPTGCGEQNMMNFVADIVILDYLKATYNLNEKVKAKAITFLESGYQREHTYRHGDGSFSAFGSSDSQGSTWLTAFVVRSFIQAKPHITVDDSVIESALEFLCSKQFENGGLFENGKVIHSEMQGGSYTNGISLTAYAVLAFIEASQKWNQEKDKATINKNNNNDLLKQTNRKRDYSENIRNGLNYITSQTKFVDSEDPYAIVLTTYALHLANHPKKDVYFDKLQALATQNGGLTFWEVKKNKSIVPNGTEHHHFHHPWEIVTKPVSVEMTGYALLTYILRGKVSESFPLVKWLLKERNSNGGFHSTQDTVVGLTALAKYAELTKDNVTDVQVVATCQVGERVVKIDKHNSDVLQEFELANDTSSVQLRVSGMGSVLSQLTWSYYVEDAVREPAFAVDVKALGKPVKILELKICTSYLKGDASNMAIIEVNLPSGYSVDKSETLDNLRIVPGYKRNDVENSDTKLSIYMDSITNKNICVVISAQMSFKVGKQVPSFVTVYDYYDTTRSARVFYEAPAVSICDICRENNDCVANNCV